MSNQAVLHWVRGGWSPPLYLKAAAVAVLGSPMVECNQCPNSLWQRGDETVWFLVIVLLTYVHCCRTRSIPAHSSPSCAGSSTSWDGSRGQAEGSASNEGLYAWASCLQSNSNYQRLSQKFMRTFALWKYMFLIFYSSCVKCRGAARTLVSGQFLIWPDAPSCKTLLTPTVLQLIEQNLNWGPGRFLQTSLKWSHHWKICFFFWNREQHIYWRWWNRKWNEMRNSEWARCVPDLI